MRDLLMHAGVTAPIIDITPILQHSNEDSQLIIAEGREAEILAWINKNDYRGDYIVIDDEIGDMKQLPYGHILHCKDGWSNNTGLTKDLVDTYLEFRRSII